MEVRINGKRYNTKTAWYVDSFCGNDDKGSFYYFYEELYQKRTGEFFIYGEGGAETQYAEHLPDGATRWGCAIRPITKEEAKEWVLAHSRDTEYKLFFGEEPKEDK